MLDLDDVPLQIRYERERLRLIGRSRSFREPLEGLKEFAKLSGALQKGTQDMVDRARAQGRTWAEIGSALGIDEQTVRTRFG